MEKMETDEGDSSSSSNWRKEMDSNLKRLQSHLFGVDRALERQDFSTAQILGLRLLGFLDSQSKNDVDDAFIHPIRQEVRSKLNIANRTLADESDRQAFEQAKVEQGPVFVKRGDIDIDKVKQSKRFQAFIHKYKTSGSDPSVSCPSVNGNQSAVPVSSNGNGHQVSQVGQLDKQNDKFSSKNPKVMTQTKLTSLYSGKAPDANNNSYKKPLNTKSNSSAECSEKVQPYEQHHHHKRDGFSKYLRVDEDEKNHQNSLGTKRMHLDVSSHKDVIEIPPSLNEEIDGSNNSFVTARAKLEADARQKRGSIGSPSDNSSARGYGVRPGGLQRRGIRGNFVPPIKSNGSNMGHINSRISGGKGDDALDDATKKCMEILCGPDGELPEKLRNLEPRLLEHVSNEIMDRDPNVRWDDIAGLEHAKKCVTEMVIWPLLRPDIFKGCRSPGRGLLLFGPPGTGKTMIGKAIAGEAKATFFYISASSLTSKWIGEGEKLVRALFGVASCRQPAVIFVDEIDSLLSQRKSEGEHESSRRLKTQFLIEMEGFDSGSEQILLIGATNRPQELDEAARRRLTKRLYIPLPSAEARAWIIRRLLEKDGLFKLSQEDTNAICRMTEGYSGSDMTNLVKDACMGPLRDACRQGKDIANLRKEDLRTVTLQDFEYSLQEVRPSVSSSELDSYEVWNKQFGSLSL
ncbi:hypothetical protein MKW94_028213 [Papaver nudicaule]|uniref:AAA+ ATPase domain-containing protein n=1 Tax=Papaver nudicaule TaxID=74823 RepID=A0AA41VB99_PAPNU|nr:hypothetical protein [Papaver nudicaule]